MSIVGIAHFVDRCITARALLKSDIEAEEALALWADKNGLIGLAVGLRHKNQQVRWAIVSSFYLLLNEEWLAQIKEVEDAGCENVTEENAPHDLITPPTFTLPVTPDNQYINPGEHAHPPRSAASRTRARPCGHEANTSWSDRGGDYGMYCTGCESPIVQDPTNGFWYPTRPADPDRAILAKQFTDTLPKGNRHYNGDPPPGYNAFNYSRGGDGPNGPHCSVCHGYHFGYCPSN